MKKGNLFDREYWEERYNIRQTGWDIGRVSPPIKMYLDQLHDRSLRVLVPGAGGAYEAIYAWELGFRNVVILDIARQPLVALREEYNSIPTTSFVHGDFFDHQGKYDIILEQAFFCALDPSLRQDYVEKMHELLEPEGKLVGLLWDDPMNDDQPPFGGNVEEYRGLFEKRFQIEIMETAYNSIKPRAERELFIKLKKNLKT